MREYAGLMWFFFALAKTYVRYWLFRPVHERPAFARHNETLRVIELAAWLAFIGGFFFSLNCSSLVRTCLLAAALLLYDAGLRYCFLQVEIRRLLASSRKWSHRGATRQVLRRARMPLAS